MTDNTTIKWPPTEKDHIFKSGNEILEYGQNVANINQRQVILEIQFDPEKAHINTFIKSSSKLALTNKNGTLLSKKMRKSKKNTQV